MKHPLTSKERRGLVAVAAAALLCISSAFIFRNCNSLHNIETAPSSLNSSYHSNISNNSDSSNNSKNSDRSNSSNNSNNPDSSNRSNNSKKSKKSKPSNKTKAEKTYPVRDPLSQPCD